MVFGSSCGLKLFKTDYIAFPKDLYCKNIQQVYFYVKNESITCYPNGYCWTSITPERWKSVWHIKNPLPIKSWIFLVCSYCHKTKYSFCNLQTLSIQPATRKKTPWSSKLCVLLPTSNIKLLHLLWERSTKYVILYMWQNTEQQILYMRQWCFFY